MIIKLILAQNYLKIALIGFVTRVTWWVPLVEQELFTLPEHMNSHPVFSEVCITWSLVFSVVFCRLLFILLSFSFWPYCLSFFDLRILITPVSIFKLFLKNMLSYSLSQNAQLYTSVFNRWMTISRNIKMMRKQRYFYFWTRHTKETSKQLDGISKY
jgi:hypothetical protein